MLRLDGCQTTLRKFMRLQGRLKHFRGRMRRSEEKLKISRQEERRLPRWHCCLARAQHPEVGQSHAKGSLGVRAQTTSVVAGRNWKGRVLRWFTLQKDTDSESAED